jgi:phage terminase Nu1 subunit (DNA packaging protein)
MARYVTAEELALEVGGIKARTVRSLHERGIPKVKLGKAWLYPLEKALAWIEAQEQSCPDQTSGRGSSTSMAALQSTSSGMKADVSGPAALARQTAERLKCSSPASSASVSFLKGR